MCRVVNLPYDIHKNMDPEIQMILLFSLTAALRFDLLNVWKLLYDILFRK